MQLIFIAGLFPPDPNKKVSYEDLQILLQTLENESIRMAKMADQLADCSDTEVMKALR